MTRSYNGSRVVALNKFDFFKLHDAFDIMKSEHHVRPCVGLVVIYNSRYRDGFICGCVVISAQFIDKRSYKSRLLVKLDFEILVLHREAGSGNIRIDMYLRQVAVFVPAGFEPIDGIAHCGDIGNEHRVKMGVVGARGADIAENHIVARIIGHLL